MHSDVQNYYGKTLQSSADLQTNACCTDGAPPELIRQALSRVHDEVQARYYGCGLVAPQQLDGLRVLDLGSGSGRDCYVLAQLVGEGGEIVGVDMTEEQLEIANRHLDYHRTQFGYAESNVRFLYGYIEKLDELDLTDESFDLIISNCVINLSPDKPAVFREAFRLLKPGGELYFSDVYADRRVPQALRDDPVLYGECLSGALYWNDFLNLAKASGFADPRLVEDRPLTVDNPELQQKLGDIRFYSATYRLFKIPGLEPACEDYGQQVRYLGTISEQPEAFDLDGHHRIPRNEWFPVCGNTYRMLAETRFRDHFEFSGDWSVHRGLFAGCGGGMPFRDTPSTTTGSCCC